MELEIIAFFQEQFFQWIIYILSYMGHLFVVLGAAAIVYLAVDKRLGARMLTFYFTSMLCNAYLKEWIARDRPYKSGAKQIIETAEQPSMPSGHAQGFAALMLPVARRFTGKPAKSYLITAALLVFVCLSRVYLGQHYLTDVLAGAGIGIAIAILVELVYVLAKHRAELILLAVLLPVSIALMCVFPGYRDAFVSAGILTGSLIGILLERRFVNYEIKGSLLNRIFKVLCALAICSPFFLPGVLLMDVIFENLAIYFIFLFPLIAYTFLAPLLFTKIKWFNHIFNQKLSKPAPNPTESNQKIEPPAA